MFAARGVVSEAARGELLCGLGVAELELTMSRVAFEDSEDEDAELVRAKGYRA